MNVLTIEKKLLGGRVARIKVLNEKNKLAINDKGIKVFVAKGYVNGTKVNNGFFASEDELLNPKTVSTKTLFVDKSEKNLTLLLIDTTAFSSYCQAVTSSSKGERYHIRDADEYRVNKVLNVSVSFNYHVKDIDYDHVEDKGCPLRKFLDFIGISDLEKDFLVKDEKFKAKWDKVSEVVRAEVKNAVESGESISKVKTQLKTALQDKLDSLLGEVGIGISGLDAYLTVMGDDMLTPEELAENNTKRAEAKKQQISTDAEIARYKQSEESKTRMEGAVQENEVQGVRNQGNEQNAQSRANIKMIEAETEGRIYRCKSASQLIFELINDQPDLFMTLIKTFGQRSGGMLPNNNLNKQTLLDAAKAAFGSFDTSAPPSLPQSDELPSDTKGTYA